MLLANDFVDTGLELRNESLLERFLQRLNRLGFPLWAWFDSPFMPELEAGMDGQSILSGLA